MNKENYETKRFVTFVLLSQRQWDIFARWQGHSFFGRTKLSIIFNDLKNAIPWKKRF